jgi:hypothetical protein
VGYGFWQPRVSWRGLGDLAALWTPGTPLLAPGSFLYGPNPPRVPWMPLLLLGLLLPALFLALAWVRGRPRAPLLFHAGALYAGLGALVVIASWKPIWHVRYALALLPFHAGGLAVAVVALRTRFARAAALAALVALSLPGLAEEKRRPGRTPWRETAAYLAERERAPVLLIGPAHLGDALGWYYKGPIRVFAYREQLVAAAREAAEGGGTVLVVYCNAHGPPDPHHLGAWQLKQALELRGGRTFGPLRVYEFAKPRGG